MDNSFLKPRHEQLASRRTSDQLRFFADGPSKTRIVIAVTFDANRPTFGSKVMHALGGANTGVLKNASVNKSPVSQSEILEKTKISAHG